MTAYYNEIDPYAAQWLRNLIQAGHIAPGIVDERSISDVTPSDLHGFTQCHFFAGIGVWSHALRRAGWPDDRPVWTGSCPCQPFSAAGKRNGFDDERHLWPHWFHLISLCKPPVILGEQVASKDGLGWLDTVSADLEGTDYAFAAADLCAAGFGGAHIRQRLYFVSVANTDNEGLQGRNGLSQRASERLVGTNGMAGGLANAPERPGQPSEPGPEFGAIPPGDGPSGSRTPAPMLGRELVDWLYCRDGKWRPVEPGTFPMAHEATSRVGRLRAYGNGLDAETATQFIASVMDCLPS